MRRVAQSEPLARAAKEACKSASESYIVRLLATAVCKQSPNVGRRELAMCSQLVNRKQQSVKLTLARRVRDLNLCGLCEIVA